LIKVSDYIAKKLSESGMNHVFMITGGGAMHLNDSFGKNNSLRVIYSLHEQACAIAAEGYARISGNPGVVCVTSGPGGTNAITGVLGAWLDSIPMLVISGQVRYDTTVRSTGLQLRQFGDQEFDITKSVATMTKYAVMVTNPLDIRYHLERALYLIKIGRPGPCWLDIPLNVQSALIDEADLREFNPVEDLAEFLPKVTRKTIKEIIKRIEITKRPVLYVGSAIRYAGASTELEKLISLLNVPVVTAFNAHDLISEDHPLYCGRPGTIGERAGNFVVQNSDLLLVLGCRLNIRQIGYNWESFAREAYKIIVDIDQNELKKPSVIPDLPVWADVADVINGLLDVLGTDELSMKKDWVNWCKERKEKYTVVLKEYWEEKELVNSYCFIEALSRHLPEDYVVACGNATACICPFQALKIKKGQRLFSNSGAASMGYDLPAAIGASFGNNQKNVLCLAGDGSIQMNLQELQMVVHYQLPIKIFVLNNNGYHSIRQTQTNFFGLPLVGCDPASGISFPDMKRVAYAYKIPFRRCKNHNELEECILATLNSDGPFICEVMLNPKQPFAPKMSSVKLPDGRMVSKPLEDMVPFLEREEFKENMIVEPISEN
jgi:acetolactate synthase-1/2/3 large subunit